MPNIVITEGLDKPWELSKTELNVTKDTNLDNINLTNQVVGQLAYTSSELLTGLTKEKDNLDKIVDAIDSVTTEIGLFPDRIAAWDKATVSVDKVNLSAIPVPIPLSLIATTSDINNTDILQANATDISLGGPPSQAQYTKNQALIDAITPLIAAKPLLDAQNISFSTQGYAFLVPNPNASSGTDQALWFVTGKLVEGTTPGVGGAPLDLVVYRNAAGTPTSYEVVGNPRVVLSPSQVLSFFVPKDDNEKTSMQYAINSSNLIQATNALKNTTGLPEGVTPPVTTLGPNIEKYYDAAKYVMKEFTQDGDSIFGTNSNAITMFGKYPPEVRSTLDLSQMTQNDIGKFFKETGSTNVYYIVDVKTDGKVVFRVGSAEPYINNMTDDIKKTLRGEYAEKQILLTQRSTDQTVYVNSISQRYTTFSDMATNLLKTLMNFYNDVARNIRS
jgi:hypothetical protein